MSRLDNNIEHNKDRNILYMIPKIEKHIEYVLAVVLKLPRVEKFNIGEEMKCIVYDSLRNILLLSKANVSKRLDIANKIDANICYEKSLVRIMYKQRYIDNKKYMYMMEELIALGNMLGGYIKYLNGNAYA